MIKYTPFLKLKNNEFSALKNLEQSIKDRIVPFFDVPQQEDEKSHDEVAESIKRMARKCKLNLQAGTDFYLDNYDIEDRRRLDGKNAYLYILEQFAELNVIPVTGLNRSPDRQQAVYDALRDGYVSDERIAIRLTIEDLEDYRIVRRELLSLIGKSTPFFQRIVLVIDLRVCISLNSSATASLINSFIVAACDDFEYEEIIISGSSIPSSSGQIIGVGERKSIMRNEVEVFRNVLFATSQNNLSFGDYTTVSPDYSGADIPPEAMQSVITARYIYAYDRNLFLMRSPALRSHPRRNGLYNDMALELVNMPFYRGQRYSTGDAFFMEKANNLGKPVYPHTAVGPMVNAHITYMVRDFRF